MFRFVSQKLISRSGASLTKTIPHVCYLQTQSLKSKSVSVKDEKTLITVSYLVNSCGFSLESATKVSKKINIRSTQNADTVLKLFRAHGLTDKQITNLFTGRPSLLLSNPYKTLKPKIEYFKSMGISTHLLADLISKQPSVLARSLKNSIVPSFNYIRTFVVTENNLVSVLKSNSRLLAYNVEKLIKPNISILRNHGVPEPNICRWVTSYSRYLMVNPDRIEMAIARAKKLEFDPTSGKFTVAVAMLASFSEMLVKQKMEAYKSFGLSEEDFQSAFKLQPLVMMPSEKNIKKFMAFFVTNLEWKPSVVSKYPKLMLCSLEKSIIPRCSVLQILLSKGIVKKDLINIPSELTQVKKRFLNKFVIKYQYEIPEVMDAHQGKIEFRGFQNNSKSL